MVQNLNEYMFYHVTSSDTMSCIEIDKPLVGYRFFSTPFWQNPNIFTLQYDFKSILMSNDREAKIRVPVLLRH